MCISPLFFYVAEQTILPLPSSEQDKKGKNCLKRIWQKPQTSVMMVKRRRCAMKCPYCGKEMTLGYIQNREGVYWTEKKRKVAALLAGGGNTIQLGDLTSNPFCMGETEAWNCQACKTIIIPYEEGKGNETELV